MEGWKITNPQDSCSALPRQSGICQTTAKNKTPKTTCLDFLFHYVHLAWLPLDPHSASLMLLLLFSF